MIAEMMARRTMTQFIEAVERKDLAGALRFSAADVVVEMPAGGPLSGAWCGRDEVRRLFAAIFEHNESLHYRLRDLAVIRGWSPTGSMKIFAEVDMEQRGYDGDVLEVTAVIIGETRRWKTTRERMFFSDLPAILKHYAGLRVPAKTD